MQYLALLTCGSVVLAGCYKHDISVTQAKNCSVINIGPVTVANRKATCWDKLEFRRFRNPDVRFMVGVFSDQIGEGRPPVHGKEKFSFDLTSLSGVRGASEADWEKGDVVPLYHKFLETTCSSPELENRRAIEYGGKKLPRTGEKWASPECAFESPNGQWITLQSWDPKPPQRFRFGFEPPNERRPGDSNLYIDVFDALTAQSVASAQLVFAGIIADTYYDDTGWLTGRHLVLPVTHPRLENFVICDTGRQ